MKVSIPGLPGVYYDTNAESTAISATMTLAGRRAPKPYGYAAQLLPILWSFDIDLREVPSDHPFQYLHPEGAHSFDELARDDRLAELGRELDFALQFVNSVNDETEAAVSKLVGREDDGEEIVIEVEASDGEVVNVERDREHEHEFDVDADPASPDTASDVEDDGGFGRTDDPFDVSEPPTENEGEEREEEEVDGDGETDTDDNTFDSDRDR